MNENNGGSPPSLGDSATGSLAALKWTVTVDPTGILDPASVAEADAATEARVMRRNESPQQTDARTLVSSSESQLISVCGEDAAD